MIRCEILRTPPPPSYAIITAQNVSLSAGPHSLWAKFTFSRLDPFPVKITREILNVSPGCTPTCTAWVHLTSNPSVHQWKSFVRSTSLTETSPKALKSKLCRPPLWCVELFLSPCLRSAVCLLAFASLCLFGGTWCFYARNEECCLLRPGTVTFRWPAPQLPCGRAARVDSHWPFLMISWLLRQPLADLCLCHVTPSLRPCSQACSSQCTQIPLSLFFSVVSPLLRPAVLSASTSAHSPSLPPFITHYSLASIFLFSAF